MEEVYRLMFKSVKKFTQQISADEISHDNNNSIITASTPYGSNISFSSSLSSKGSSSSLINDNKKMTRKLNSFTYSQEKTPLATNRVANTSVRSENNSWKKVLNKDSNKSDSSNKNSFSNSGRTTTDSYSPARSGSSSPSNKIQTNKAQNASRSSIINNFFTPNQSSSSSSLSDSNSSNSTNFSIRPLVEGSLEYRELKRLYLEEKKAKEEWEKDYKVLKQQLAHLRSTTIRECNLFLLHWC
ncbi:unnamed protein product [Rotaria sp. Silwood2]|nr:unnamed protein product [Rotaria sp. Silwood2]